MFTWWDSLSLVAQIFACIAVPATLVLVIQTVLMLIGVGDEGGDADIEIDADGDGIFDGDIDPTGLDALKLHYC